MPPVDTNLQQATTDSVRTQVALHLQQRIQERLSALTVSELRTVLRFVEFLAQQDGDLTEEAALALEAAKLSTDPGIPHEEILREFGLR